ncbi:MAG: Gfo/Idh/MocA family oxidoreductase [Methanomassiliicoccales archaeon]|nr:MAG: Gfo/Idh/MocA family oxidoreductase [Methanomassiliicoccales archaeon]
MAVMLNTGVIGVGSMGRNHARVLSEISNLVGIADPDKKAGESVSSKMGTQYFKDYQDLLKEDIQAVSIAAPTNVHFEIAKDVMSKGVHPLVEKPMCLSLEDSEKMVKLAKDAGLTLAIGHIERHNPVVAFAKKALAGGAYGEAIALSARRVSSFPARIKDVGVIMDLGIHDVDVMRYLLGSEVESVFTQGKKMKHDVFEDHANILLDFKNGTTGFVEINWLTPMKVRKLSLTCSKNFVELDYVKQSLVISSSSLMEYDPFNLYQVPLEYDIRKVSLQKEEPLKNELSDFLNAITRKKDPLVTGEDALMTMRAIMAAIESSKTKNRIEL